MLTHGDSGNVNHKPIQNRIRGKPRQSAACKMSSEGQRAQQEAEDRPEF